jgi:hypothetical protein
MTPKEVAEQFPEFLAAFQKAADPHNGRLVAVERLPNTDTFSVQAEAYGQRAARNFELQELEMERGGTAFTSMQLQRLFDDLKKGAPPPRKGDR